MEAGPVGREALRAVYAGYAAKRDDHERRSPRAVQRYAHGLHRQPRPEQEVGNSIPPPGSMTEPTHAESLKETHK